MIYYNMRYRGPYEYDKFTLNILNYINFVNDYINDMENYEYSCPTSVDEDTFITLKEFQDKIDEAFEKVMEHSETVYRQFIMNKGGE